MKSVVLAALAAVSFAGAVHAAEEGGMAPANIRVDDIASLQRGSRLFFNYCSGCHSLQFMRYSRIAEDLKLDDKEVQASLIFTGAKIGDKATNRHFFFLAACGHVTDELRARIAGAPLLFFDGTVWHDDELIAQGLGTKTGQSMGHIAMSGDRGAIESLAGLDIDRKLFLHVNNSNPALLSGSKEREIAERAGWQIPTDGTEIVL